MDQFYHIPELKIGDIKRLARRSLSGKWLKAFVPMLIIIAALVLPQIVEYWKLLTADIGGSVDLSSTQDVMNFISKNGNSGGAASTLASIFTFLCTGAFSLSAAALSIRILRNEEFSAATAFEGFHKYLQSFLVYILVAIFSVLWALVSILPGTLIFVACLRNPVMAAVGAVVFIAAIVLYVILVLRYSMAYFIAQDNRSIPAMQATGYSVTLMKGRTGRFFLLQLSFIGWAVLAAIPAGLGSFFLNAAKDQSNPVLYFVAIVLLELYLYTSNAVFYSAVSGNFGISADAVPPQDPEPAAPEVSQLPEADAETEDDENLK